MIDQLSNCNVYVLPVSHKMLVTKCDRLTQYTRADQSNVTMLFTPSIKISHNVCDNI